MAHATFLIVFANQFTRIMESNTVDKVDNFEEQVSNE
jgi:hypothetical protein